MAGLRAHSLTRSVRYDSLVDTHHAHHARAHACVLWTATAALLINDFRMSVTIDLHVTCVSAAPLGSRLEVESTVEQAGKSILFTSCRIFTLGEGGKRTLVATGVHTKRWLRVSRPSRKWYRPNPSYSGTKAMFKVETVLPTSRESDIHWSLLHLRPPSLACLYLTCCSARGAAGAAGPGRRGARRDPLCLSLRTLAPPCPSPRRDTDTRAPGQRPAARTAALGTRDTRDSGVRTLSGSLQPLHARESRDGTRSSISRVARHTQNTQTTHMPCARMRIQVFLIYFDFEMCNF